MEDKCLYEDCYNPRVPGEMYCQSCIDTMDMIEAEFIDDSLEAGAFLCTESIFCPYCGVIQSEISEDGAYDYRDEGEHDMICADCGMIFKLDTEVIVEFSTYRTDVLEEEEDDEEY